jgi:thiol-disulfide isomerase/thioredoxin
MKQTMKTLFTVICTAMVLGVIGRAEDLTKYKTADELWAYINNLGRGPQEQPQSREEIPAVFHRFWDQLDSATGEFLKLYPNDPNRWGAKLLKLQVAYHRGQADNQPVDVGATTNALKEIVAAADASPSTRGEAQGWLAQFDAMARAEAKTKALKEKPLELKFTTVDGKDFDLANWRGKVVLVDFWATWCGPCRAEIPRVVETYKKLNPKGFEIIGISLDREKDRLVEYAKQKEMTWPQYYDGKVWENKISTGFGIMGIPTMWLVDKKGFVRSTEARADLEQQVTKLLSE